MRRQRHSTLQERIDLQRDGYQRTYSRKRDFQFWIVVVGMLVFGLLTGWAVWLARIVILAATVSLIGCGGSLTAPTSIKADPQPHPPVTAPVCREVVTPAACTFEQTVTGFVWVCKPERRETICDGK